MNINIHTGEILYQYNKHDTLLLLNNDFTIHIKIHTRLKPYQCIICDKFFAQIGNTTVNKGFKLMHISHIFIYVAFVEIS